VRPDLLETLRGLVAGQLPWPLYLWGDPGTGKTSAALALLDLVGPEPVGGKRPDVIRDWAAGFVEVRHLPRICIGADQLRFQWSRDGLSGDVTRESLDRALATAPLFVFDELGVAREASDFRLDLLLDVLGSRCDDPVKPFVVTSNRSPEEIEQKVYDGRVASRVLCGTVFNLNGPDRRFAA
jgi:predicted ATPase